MVNPLGINFNEKVYVYTTDMFSFTSNGTTADAFPGGGTAYTAGTETFSVIEGQEPGVMEFTATDNTNILPGTESGMTALGAVTNNDGSTLIYNGDMPLNAVQTWEFTVEGGDGTPWWVAQFYEDSADKPIYVSNYNLNSGETFNIIGNDTSPSEISPDGLFQGVYGQSFQQGATGLTIADAATPDAPIQAAEPPSYKAWLATDIIFNTDGTLTINPDAIAGSFVSYDNDDYFSDGFAGYDSPPNDLNQLGEANFLDENNNVINVWDGRTLFQAEVIHLVQGDDSNGPFQFIGISNESGNGFLYVTTTDVDAGQTFDLLLSDGSPGFVNGALAEQQEQSAIYKTLITCFARGTRIKTALGDVLIEDLAPGDLVLTRDNGYQPIRWIGCSEVSEQELEANTALRPVRIRAGSLGPNMPEQTLVVSQQHRVLISSKIAERMFGSHEVLIAAKNLLAMPGVTLDENAKNVSYYHILFDHHEIVNSHGMLTESLYTGPEALKAISEEARKEILTLFPELETADYTPTPCRTLGGGGRAMRLAIRHKANKLPLVCSDDSLSDYEA